MLPKPNSAVCNKTVKRETVLPQVGPSDLQTLVLFCGWHSFNNTVKNHAGMLWSLQHVRLMGTNGKNKFTTTMLVTFLPWKDALIFFKRTNRIMVSGPKTMAASRSDRPAFGIWPDRGERQLCVWCHSSESHQSHTGWNTSVSRTHNCLPLKKHRTDFKNRAIWAQHDWVWSSELMESLSSTFPLTQRAFYCPYHLTRKLDILSSKLKQTLTNVKTAVSVSKTNDPSLMSNGWA